MSWIPPAARLEKPQLLHGSRRLGRWQAVRGHVRIGYVQHDALRIMQSRHGVRRAARQIEHNPRAIRARPQAHIPDLYGSRREGRQ